MGYCERRAVWSGRVFFLRPCQQHLFLQQVKLQIAILDFDGESTVFMRRRKRDAVVPQGLPLQIAQTPFDFGRGDYSADSHPSQIRKSQGKNTGNKISRIKCGRAVGLYDGQSAMT